MALEMSDLEPLPSGVLERLKNVSSGTLTTLLFKRGFRQRFMVGIKPLTTRALRFAGEAYTMRFIPAREDKDTLAGMTSYPSPENLQWVGVESIQAGQVLVIDSRNDPSAASGGDILLTRLMVKGVAGVVSDGGFRDGLGIAELDLPVYARQVVATTRMVFHRVADLQVPIGCAGVAVYPGDIIVGDGDGITVVPRHLAAEIADEGEAQDALEDYVKLRIAGGESLYGVYPPTEQTRADYRAWCDAGSNPSKALEIRAARQVQE